MLAQTIRLRTLLIGGSGMVSITAPAPFTAFGAGLAGTFAAAFGTGGALFGGAPSPSGFFVSTTPSVETVSDWLFTPQTPIC